MQNRAVAISVKLPAVVETACRTAHLPRGTGATEGTSAVTVAASHALLAQEQAADTARDTTHTLLPDRAYVLRTTHNNVLRGMRFDAPALRFTMGRSTRALTLDAVDAVHDGGEFVPIGAWYVEPVA